VHKMLMNLTPGYKQKQTRPAKIDCFSTIM
jgi:hypothetical protein